MLCTCDFGCRDGKNRCWAGSTPLTAEDFGSLITLKQLLRERFEASILYYDFVDIKILISMNITHNMKYNGYR